MPKDAVCDDDQELTICIATYNRERQLHDLLRSIGSAKRPPGIDLQIVVVDNGTARVSTNERELTQLAGAPVRLCREARRGIPQSRNRAVSVALPTDFIVFVDDDEVVSAGWLTQLLEVQRRFGADVVTGPVVAAYPASTPAWAVDSAVYERPRRPTGTNLEVAATGNTLVMGTVFEQIDEWFDERLALSGGEDTEFFSRVHRSGFSIVWADEAVVTEEVAEERLRLRWVLRRGFRVGIGMAQQFDVYEPRRRVPRAVKQALIAAQLTFLAGFRVVTDRAGAVALAARAARAAGRAAGHIGYRFDEYA